MQEAPLTAYILRCPRPARRWDKATLHGGRGIASATCSHGAVPAWRAFEKEHERRDVVQLGDPPCPALGYFRQTPNGHFDWNTVSRSEWRRP